LGGTPPKPPWVGFAEGWANKPSAKQNNAFCFFFWKRRIPLGKLVYLLLGQWCFWGARPPKPPWVGFAEGWANKPSAKQNNAFCFFFWKKKNLTNPIGLFAVSLMLSLRGTPPKLPWVGFAEGWANKPSAKQNNAFCFFFWKKKNLTNPIGLFAVSLMLSLRGTPPKLPWVGFAEGWANKPSAKQNNAFCFFFWKKKNTTRKIGLFAVRLMVLLGVVMID
jgi:hypothetical protein